MDFPRPTHFCQIKEKEQWNFWVMQTNICKVTINAYEKSLQNINWKKPQRWSRCWKKCCSFRCVCFVLFALQKADASSLGNLSLDTHSPLSTMTVMSHLTRGLINQSFKRLQRQNRAVPGTVLPDGMGICDCTAASEWIVLLSLECKTGFRTINTQAEPNLL